MCHVQKILTTVLEFEPRSIRYRRLLAFKCITQLIASLRRGLIGPCSKPEHILFFLKDAVSIYTSQEKNTCVSCLRHLVNGRRYKPIFKDTGSVVTVLDKTVKNAKGKPVPVFRIDGPHAGHNYNHININPKISGLRRTVRDAAGNAVLSPSGRVRTVPHDPHVKLPGGSGTLTASKNVAKGIKYVNL